MTFEKIISELRSKKYHPVYFLAGDEPYYIDYICDYIADGVLSEAEKEFNQTILYGRDTNTNAVLEHAKRYPMMAEHQVVIIKEAQHLDKIDQIAGYLKNPVKTTILVFCYKYKKLDNRTSFAKLLKEKAVLFQSKKLYDNKIPGWIVSELKKKKYTITPKATLLLTEHLGNDLSRISNELKKLTLNVPKNTEITAVHIEENIGISKDFNVFELQSAIGQRDVLKANKIINYFSRNSKAHPIILTLGLLYSYFSKILLYHYLKDKSNAATELGVHPFFVKEYQIAARNYSIKKSVEIVGHLHEYDMKVKGVNNASASEGELQKELLYKILH